MTEAGSREGLGSPPWDPADTPPPLSPREADSLRVTRLELGGGAKWREALSRPPGPRRDADTRAELGGGPEWRAALSRPPGPRQDEEPQSAEGKRDGTDGEDAGQPEDAAAGRHRAKPGTRAKPKSRRKRSFWRELPILAVIAIVLALVIKTYVVQAFWIPSGSMQNTLAINDRVLVNKVVYHTRGIARGDIVVFDGSGTWDPQAAPPTSDPFVRLFDAVEGVVGITQGSDIYIKRVIGLPGDHVACCNSAGQITVNGVPLTEQSYLYPGNSPSAQKFSVTVPPGSLWVMGDHRAISYDSRGHTGDPGGGSIPESAVIGRAFVVIWPPSQWGFLNIPATFEQPRLTSSAAAAGGSPAALDAALNGNPVRLQSSWTPLPLAIGTVIAIPLTWAQRRVRRSVAGRRSRARSQ